VCSVVFTYIYVCVDCSVQYCIVDDDIIVNIYKLMCVLMPAALAVILLLLLLGLFFKTSCIYCINSAGWALRRAYGL